MRYNLSSVELSKRADTELDRDAIAHRLREDVVSIYTTCVTDAPSHYHCVL